MHTHARTIVASFFREHLSLIHAARGQLFCAAIGVVMAGHLLGVSRLARALRGHGTHKAALKRVDRLTGNGRIARESEVIAAALLRVLCKASQGVVIAVDWSAVAPNGVFVELRAAVAYAGMGRSLTVYQQVYPKSQLGNRGAERALLELLHGCMPAGVPVIITTDAGFRRPWFKEVERFGWSWIGRVRSGSGVSRDGTHWEEASAWFTQATGKACRWLDCRLTCRFRFVCDFVLYRGRTCNTKRYGRAGRGSAKSSGKARASAREPWLLAHCAQLRNYRADEIVALYRLRMQIEENFRDSKSIPLGMGLEISQSRSAHRLHALLLIGTVAAFMLWHIGQLAETEGLHRSFKATTRVSRELSIISLAILLCALEALPLTEPALQALNGRLGLRS